MNYLDHAKKEFNIAGWTDNNGNFKDEMQELVCKDVLDLLSVFSKQGHSGASAAYTIGLFKQLVTWDIISPLTGEDSEWNDVGDGLFQNNRCSRVFKENGIAYDIEGKVFRDPNGNCYTNGYSKVNIMFPYIPTTEYIDVD